MAKGLVNESSLNSIGSAINVLNGTEGAYLPSEMGEAIIDAIPTETANGNPIHITDAAACHAVSCVTTLEPVQEGSGDPSPENVRPISGHTGVELKRAGKNLWNGAWVTTALTNEYYGQWKSNYLPGNLAFPVIPGKSYTFSVNGIATLMRYRWLDRNQNPLSYLTNAYTVTAPENAYYLMWRWTSDDGTSPGDLSGSAQLELGATATTYEPYQGETHPVTFPVLGKNLFDGELEFGDISSSDGSNVNNNYTVRTKNYIPVNLNEMYTLSRDNSESYVNFRLYDKNKNYIGSGDASQFILVSGSSKAQPMTKGISSCTFYFTDDVAYLRFKNNTNNISIKFQLELGTTATTYEPYTNTVYGGEVDWVNGVLRVTEANIASYNGETLPSVWISDRDVYIEGTTPSIGAQVVYELATPIEIPLTPEIITLLKGENNIWTDSGTSEIEYTVDLQSYIQKLIDEASAQASALSVSPLSLGRSTAVSTDGESEEAEKLPVDEVESVDEADEVEEEPVEEDTEAEPIESEIWVKDPDAEEVIYKPIDVTEPDTLEKEGGDTV